DELVPVALPRQLSKLLFEAVDVAARQIVCLLDHAVASDPAAECAELRVEPLDLGRGQTRQLLEAVEAETVQRVGKLGADAFQPAEVVTRVGTPVQVAMARRAPD